MVYSDLVKKYPALHDLSQLNGKPFNPRGKLEMEDEGIWEIIEGDDLQFVAWGTQGPLVQVITLTLCEDLIHAFAQYHIVDFTLG